MSKLDYILCTVKFSPFHGGVMNLDEKRAEVKELMLELAKEVVKEQFHVDGAVNGNDLVTEGFYKFRRALLDKVDEL